jgi:hypothetical protein
MPDKKTNTPPESGVSTGSSGDRVTAKESAVEAPKSVAATTLPAKADDSATSKGNGTGSTPSSSAIQNDNQSLTKRRMTLKKVCPYWDCTGDVILGSLRLEWLGWRQPAENR